MKKITVLIVVVFIAFSSAISQPAKVTSAWNYLKNQQYDKAKENIEEAIKNEKTMALAKTWFFRGNIYLNIYLLNHTTSKVYEGMTKQAALKKNRKPVATRTIQVNNENLEQIEFKDDEEYKLLVNFMNINDTLRVYSWSKEGPFTVLDSGALDIAYDSYQKAIELDKDIMDEYIIPMSPMLGLYVIGEQFYNSGVILFNEKKYAEAMTAFERTAKVNETFNRADTMATYNAATSATLAKQNQVDLLKKEADSLKNKEHLLKISFFNDKAKKYYGKLISLNYRNTNIYSQLANIYKDDKDTLKALKTLALGRKRFPNDFSLLISETNLYLWSGQTLKAQENLMLAEKKDSTNKVIYFAIGTNFDQMHSIEQAEYAYKKAIKLDPNYFDAIFNLGAMYFNKGGEIINQANKLPLGDNNYDKMLAEGKDFLKKALPFLEKANLIIPTDISTLTSLKEIYTRLNMMDKLKEVNLKLSSIK